MDIQWRERNGDNTVWKVKNSGNRRQSGIFSGLCMLFKVLHELKSRCVLMMSCIMCVMLGCQHHSTMCVGEFQHTWSFDLSLYPLDWIKPIFKKMFVQSSLQFFLAKPIKFRHCTNVSQASWTRWFNVSKIFFIVH